MCNIGHSYLWLQERICLWLGTSSAETDGYGPLPGEFQAPSQYKVIYRFTVMVFMYWLWTLALLPARDCQAACNTCITGPITENEC